MNYPIYFWIYNIMKLGDEFRRLFLVEPHEVTLHALTFWCCSCSHLHSMSQWSRGYLLSLDLCAPRTASVWIDLTYGHVGENRPCRYSLKVASSISYGKMMINHQNYPCNLTARYWKRLFSSFTHHSSGDFPYSLFLYVLPEGIQMICWHSASYSCSFNRKMIMKPWSIKIGIFHAFLPHLDRTKAAKATQTIDVDAAGIVGILSAPRCRKKSAPGVWKFSTPG